MVLKVKVSPDLIAGDVDVGYGKVADVFRRNLTSGQEVGAAVAVYREGVKVVDLWGGFRNGITKAPWEEDTLALMFSTTKGASALAVAVAASQGLISYDARVADYWPEFAQASKGPITVRQMLSHQAGLPVIDPPPTLDDVSDPAKLSAMLAAQAPAWTPGSRHGYHAVTLGWYESELIRHADPAGRSLGQFFADEVAKPLGLDFHIGLPASVDRDRVAHLHCWSQAEMLLHLNVMPIRHRWPCRRSGGHDHHEPTWSHTPHCCVAAPARSAPFSRSERHLGVGLPAQGAGANLLRHQGRAALLHPIAAVSTAEHGGSGVEIMPPGVQTGLRDERVNEPDAMPLDEYIAETMALLTEEPEATEIVVDATKPLRFAERDGVYEQRYTDFNTSRSP